MAGTIITKFGVSPKKFIFSIRLNELHLSAGNSLVQTDGVAPYVNYA